MEHIGGEELFFCIGSFVGIGTKRMFVILRCDYVTFALHQQIDITDTSMTTRFFDDCGLLRGHRVQIRCQPLFSKMAIMNRKSFLRVGSLAGVTSLLNYSTPLASQR